MARLSLDAGKTWTLPRELTDRELAREWETMRAFMEPSIMLALEDLIGPGKTKRYFLDCYLSTAEKDLICTPRIR